MEMHEPKREQTQFHGRALVADDVTTNRILMKALLTKLGLEVTLASDGCEAVEKLSAEAFDVVFMDIQMPRMDGCQATRIVRERGCTAPIIALTAHTDEGDEATFLDAGCDDYLPKPIDGARLVETLARHLSAACAPAN